MTRARTLLCLTLAAPLACSYFEDPDEAHHRARERVQREVPPAPRTTTLSETRYADGKIRERYFVYRDASGREVMHGTYTEYFPSGGRKMQMEFREDDTYGPIKHWYESGQLRSDIMTSRTIWKQGIEYLFYLDGRMALEYRYDNGLVKEERWWHRTGHLSFERIVLESDERGRDFTTAFFRRDGRPLWHERTSLGRAVARHWDESGRERAVDIRP